MQSKSFIHTIRVLVVTGEGGTAGGHGHSNRSAWESQNSEGVEPSVFSPSQTVQVSPGEGSGQGLEKCIQMSTGTGFLFVSTGRGWARKKEITWNLSICDFFELQITLSSLICKPSTTSFSSPSIFLNYF